MDLPGGDSGRTITDIRTLESETPPSHIATFIYGLRYLLGRVFGWDRELMRPEDSFLERLSQRDRCDSEMAPGTLDGHFCIALVSSANGYILYWGSTSAAPRGLRDRYLVAIEPFRRVLYPAMLRRIRRAWIAAYAGMSRNDVELS